MKKPELIIIFWVVFALGMILLNGCGGKKGILPDLNLIKAEANIAPEADSIAKIETDKIGADDVTTAITPEIKGIDKSKKDETIIEDARDVTITKTQTNDPMPMMYVCFGLIFIVIVSLSATVHLKISKNSIELDAKRKDIVIKEYMKATGKTVLPDFEKEGL